MTKPFPLSQQKRTLHSKWLQKKVKIGFDQEGVPHIQAENHDDLIFSAGYVQGSLRFFQMDVLRRVSQGRLSEILGKKPLLGKTTVDFDQSMRVWDFQGKAKKALVAMTTKEKKKYELFCKGVNQAVQKFLPLEYRLLNIQPQPFLPQDMLSIGLLNGWTITHNWQQELVRFLMALRVGTQASKEAYPHTDLGAPSISSQQSIRKLPPGIVAEMQEWFRQSKTSWKFPSQSYKWASALTQILPQMAGASNAWVVSGKYTQSKKSMLAADPHMSHFLPSLLFPMHLQTPDMNVMGVTFAGLPYVLMGHNENISWGITAAVGDAMDLVLEKIDPKNPKHVFNESQKCPLKERKETIWILEKKKLQSKNIIIRETCNGPLVNDMLPGLLPSNVLLAVRWKPQGLEKTLSILKQANQAKEMKTFRQAMLRLPGLIATITATDKKGNIALFWAGQFPIRKNHRGTFPIPGWKAKYDWERFSTPSENPQIENPSSGYLIHANNLIVSSQQAPHIYHIDSAPQYRYNRIKELLLQSKSHNLESFRNIQRDVLLLRGKRLNPLIMALLKQNKTQLSAQEQKALKQLESWDFTASKDSIATTLFYQTYFEFMKTMGHKLLPPSGFSFFMSQRYSLNAVDHWISRPDLLLFKKGETQKALLLASFQKACKQLTQKWGKNISTWRWGRLHQLDFKHLFGRKPGISFLSFPKEEAMGAPASVWKSHFNLGHPQTPFQVVAGPVYRLLIDMKEVNKAVWSLDTGSSGWPLSPYYSNFYRLWKKGAVAPMRFQFPKQPVSRWNLHP